MARTRLCWLLGMLTFTVSTGNAMLGLNERHVHWEDDRPTRAIVNPSIANPMEELWGRLDDGQVHQSGGDIREARDLSRYEIVVSLAQQSAEFEDEFRTRFGGIRTPAGTYKFLKHGIMDMDHGSFRTNIFASENGYFLYQSPISWYSPKWKIAHRDNVRWVKRSDEYGRTTENGETGDFLTEIQGKHGLVFYTDPSRFDANAWFAEYPDSTMDWSHLAWKDITPTTPGRIIHYLESVADGLRVEIRSVGQQEVEERERDQLERKRTAEVAALKHLVKQTINDNLPHGVSFQDVAKVGGECSEDVPGICGVCFKEKADQVTGCGHCGMCYGCANQLLNLGHGRGKCPTCGKDFRRKDVTTVSSPQFLYVEDVEPAERRGVDVYEGCSPFEEVERGPVEIDGVEI